MKWHHHFLLHVTVTAARAKELWVCVAQRHHRRAEPLLSPLDKVCREVSQPEIQQMQEYFFHIRGLIPHCKLGPSMPGFFYFIVISGIIFPSALILSTVGFS